MLNLPPLKKKNNEELSQIISWGHWFALFNIILSFLIASRYLLISEWPITFLGQVYACLNFIGQFSFIVFAVYLFSIFPLSFIIRKVSWLRLLAVILASCLLTILLLDVEIYARYRLHLNATVWELLFSSESRLLLNDWQWLFVFIPFLFLIEIAYASWSWKKLRSLNKRQIGKPVSIILIGCFLCSHLLHIWADAQFYRSITMQKSNLPLSYPMTARHFLEKYGFIDGNKYITAVNENGNPSAVSVNYPLTKIKLDTLFSGYNVLMVVVDNMQTADWHNNYPTLYHFAQSNLNYESHYSASSDSDLSIFSLLYGISPNYYDGVLSDNKTSVLLDSFSQRGYFFGLFSADGFNAPLYKRALLSNFTLPKVKPFSNSQVIEQWVNWLNTQSNEPWFSFVKLDADLKDGSQKSVDNQIGRIISSISDKGVLDKTVVVITAANNKNNANIKVLDTRYEELSSLKVPLVIHWPEIGAKEVTSLSSHVDIVRTLMQGVLGVKTPESSYSQGNNLINGTISHPWMLSGDAKNLIIIMPDRITYFSDSGFYTVYDSKTLNKLDEKINVPIFLQVMTDMRRFIAN